MNKKEQKINEILNSVNGIKRAKPRPELFAQIQSKVQKSKVKRLPMYQLRIAAAVGLIIVTLNVYTFSSFFLNDASNGNELVLQENDESLISNYQIYE